MLDRYPCFESASNIPIQGSTLEDLQSHTLSLWSAFFPRRSEWMIMFPTVLAFGIAQLTVSAMHLKRWDNLAEKHSWVDVPKGWSYKSAIPADYVFNLKIALKQHRLDELIDNLMQISDPTHIRSVAIPPLRSQAKVQSDMLNISPRTKSRNLLHLTLIQCELSTNGLSSTGSVQPTPPPSVPKRVIGLRSQLQSNMQNACWEPNTTYMSMRNPEIKSSALSVILFLKNFTPTLMLLLRQRTSEP